MMNEHTLMIIIIITAVLSALIYFLGWLIYEYISYRKLLKEESKVRQHLQDYPLSDYHGIDFLGDSEDYDDLDDLLDEYYRQNCLQKVYANILEEAMIQDIENDNLEDEYYHHDEDYYRNNSDFVIIEKDANESINQ